MEQFGKFAGRRLELSPGAKTGAGLGVFARGVLDHRHKDGLGALAAGTGGAGLHAPIDGRGEAKGAVGGLSGHRKAP